MNKFYMRL